MRFDLHPFSKGSPSKSDPRDACPLDSPDSYRLMVYMRSSDILPVPVWPVSTFLEVDPVRINCPGPE